VKDEPYEIQACRDFLEANFAYKRGERDVITAMMFAKAEWKAIVALKIWNQRKAASKSVATRVVEWLRRTDTAKSQPSTGKDRGG
jgi:phage gp16-like protein